MIFLLALIASTICTLLIIKMSKVMVASQDSKFDEPQKFHQVAVPRIGGLGILITCLLIGGYIFFQTQSLAPAPQALSWQVLFQSAPLGLQLLVCALPAFLIGFIEDFTKKISPSMRFLFCCLSAVAAYYFLNAGITRVEIPWIDGAFEFAAVSILFTVFAVAGLCNAVNIIDGFNGLAGFVSAMMFLSLAYVSSEVGDAQLMMVSLLMAGAILGFLIWNFPLGLIFLGDGGAYFIGFMLAEIAILLCARHAQVSVWYPVLLFSYPIVETLFSIYRKKFIRGISPSVPDGVHLHMLVFRRLIKWAVGKKSSAHMTLKNSATSPYLWALAALAITPATIFWNLRWALGGFIVLFCVSYVWLYFRIVRFKIPAWLRLNRRMK